MNQVNCFKKPAHYNVLQLGDEAIEDVDSCILVLEVLNAGLKYIGTFDSQRWALEFAAEFDEHVNSAQHWLLIETYRDPKIHMVMPHINMEQLR